MRTRTRRPTIPLGGGATGPLRCTRPRLLALLPAAGRSQADLALHAFDEHTIRWGVETGLGPLLLKATARDPQAATSPLWPLVQGANLTARLLTALHMDAMAEIIDACATHSPPLVLLKGISMCEQHYPEPHLRPMRDIDFLVEADRVPMVESILSRLGYRQHSDKPPAFYEQHHHSSPFVHPDTGVWVDVHRALVPSHSEFGSDDIFGPEHLTTQLRSSTFRGRPVRRLSNELQIVHLACHWARGLHAVGGMVAMADMTYLLQSAPTIQWERILEWMDVSVASRHLCLLLTYLDRHGLIDIPLELLQRLGRTPAAPGPLTLAIAHALIDGYVVDGRAFGRLMSERNFTRLWRILVLRRPSARTFRPSPPTVLREPLPATDGGRGAWNSRSRSGGIASGNSRV